jgi:hypothetical protein
MGEVFDDYPVEDGFRGCSRTKRFTRMPLLVLPESVSLIAIAEVNEINLLMYKKTTTRILFFSTKAAGYIPQPQLRLVRNRHQYPG